MPPKTRPRFFLCGIIQGSHAKKKVHKQGYRTTLTRILNKAFPDVEVYNPFAEFPDSLEYSPAKARKVFFHEMETAAAKGSILIAYLPRASLGTAIEMWEAHKYKNPVFVITPLGINWAVQCLGTKAFRTIREFKAFVEKGGLKPYVAGKKGR